MASSGGNRSGHGGVRLNAGRKRSQNQTSDTKKAWERCHKRISLETRIFDSWINTKQSAGYGRCTDSAFAAHLLSLEYRRRELLTCNINMSVSNACDNHPEGPVCSTPVRASNYVQPGGGGLFVSPILKIYSPSNENNSVNKILNSSMFSDDECSASDGEDINSDVNHDRTDSYQELHNSAIHVLNEDGDSGDESEKSDSLIDLGKESWSDDACDDAESASDGDSGDEGTEETSKESNEIRNNPGVHNKLSRNEDYAQLQDERKLINEKKFICSLDLLLEVFLRCCQVPGCSHVPIVKHHFIGATVVVNCYCPAGHSYKFTSSREVNGIFANNLQSAAAILLSGNNFQKINRMVEFLGLAFISTSTFYRFQRLYFFPAIEEWWAWMQKELIQEFIGKEVVVSGDGQCDSPGFSAKNLCYFIMEISSNYILEVEVRDKRHVNLSSVNMEKQALTNALKRLQSVLNVVEITTDASASIKKLMVDEFKGVFHSLDIWHKSKSIRKCLGKIGKAKRMSKIKDWSNHIIRHFWHCCSACKVTEATSDEEALTVLKDMWIGLLHHVCGEHEWLGGKCNHDNEVHDPNLEWFDRREKDFEELQKIVLNKDLLESFRYYVRFRHTGALECANSLSLVYTPKRTPFSYRAYKNRKFLAAIDWNYHQGLPHAKNQSGEVITTRKYNQRTQQWDTKVVKANKGYEYIPLLMAKILRRRMLDVDVVTRNVSLNASDPCLLAPTIAAKPPPSDEELLIRSSRFGKTYNTPQSDKGCGHN